MTDLLNSFWSSLEAADNKGFYINDEKSGGFNFISYKELAEKSGYLALCLDLKNIPNRVPVLFSAATGLEFVLLWLAFMWKGCIPVPMPPAEALIGENQFENRIKDIIPHFDHYICFKREEERIGRISKPGLNILSFETLFEDFDIRNNILSPPPRVKLTPDDTAFYQFTSGSTSAPKGIIITYTNLTANITATWERLAINREKHRIGSWLPLYHDMGLVGFFLGSLFTQTELVLQSPLYFAKRPLRFLETVEKYKINYCGMPNFALKWINRTLERKKDFFCDLSTLRWIGVGAEPVNINTLKQFEKKFTPMGLKEGVLSPCYGLAEATLAVSIDIPFTQYSILTRKGQIFPTVGPALSNIDTVIRSEGAGIPGNLYIKGDAVAREALINGRKVSLLDGKEYYSTGDIGCFHGNRLVILGREDEMFIVNGENMFPYDIENAVCDTGLVRRNRVVCFALESETGMIIVVLYESKSRDEESINQIFEVLAGKTGISDFIIHPVPLKSIPVTSSGKIKRKTAKTRYLNDKDGWVIS